MTIHIVDYEGESDKVGKQSALGRLMFNHESFSWRKGEILPSLTMMVVNTKGGGWWIVKRIDLIYDIETNLIYPFDQGWEIDSVKLASGDISIFCPDWSLQQQTGGMSFQMLKDNLRIQ